MMSHLSIHGAMCATVLLLGAGSAAEAQDPHSASQASVVQHLGLDSAATATGNMRELRCRGQAGIDLRVHRDSVPDLPGYVTMVLRYDLVKATRSMVQEGMGLTDHGATYEFIPGACNWGWGYIPEIPAEPGLVYFDLPRDAQTHIDPGSRDTTVEAAAYFPDLANLSRYLGDPSRWWVFYVDDVSNAAMSFGPWPLGGAYTSIESAGVAGSLREASPERAGAAAPAAAAVESARAAPGRDTLSSARTVPTETGAGGPRDARTRPEWLLQRGIPRVHAAPGPRGVRLTFQAAGNPLFSVNHSVGVMISRTAPSWDAGAGLWNLVTDSDFATIRPVSGGGYMAEPSRKLKAGHRYYYLITVGGPRVSTRQRTGFFTAEVVP